MSKPPKIQGLFMVQVEADSNLTRLVYTQDLRKRFSEWQNSAPMPLRIVDAYITVDSDDAFDEWIMATDNIGNYLHYHIVPDPLEDGKRLARVFQDYRVKNNWFSVQPRFDWCKGGDMGDGCFPSQHHLR